MDKPAFCIKYWSATKQMRPTNHDGPLDSAKLVAVAVLNEKTYPDAVRYTIHDYKTDKQVYP
jgi:hypothetical protein